MPMPTLAQIIGTITGKVAFERTQANFNTIKDAHNGLETSLTTHKAESASKHIKESGSNANGSYIKYDDGTMICRQYISAFGNVEGAVASYTWTFPASFVVDLPAVSVGAFSNSNMYFNINNQSFITANIIKYGDPSNYAAAMPIAIGRWK